MQGLQRQRWLKILLGALPMLAMMIVIFIFSGSMGGESSEQSNAVGKWVLGILGIEIPPGQTASDVPILWGLTIRKFAHIFLSWRERIFVYGNVADGESPAAETCVVRRRSAADFFCVRVPGRVASVIRCRTKRENGRCRNRCDRVYYGGSDMCGDMVSDAPDLREEIGTSTSGEFAPIKDFFNT